MSMTRGYVVGLMIGHLQHALTQLQWAQGGLEQYWPALPTPPKGKKSPPHPVQWVRVPITILADYIDRAQQLAVQEAGLDDAEITRGIAHALENHAEQSRVWLEHMGEEGRQLVWNEITDPPRIPRTPVHLPE